MTPPADTPTGRSARPRTASWLRPWWQARVFLHRAGQPADGQAVTLAAGSDPSYARGHGGLLAFVGIGLLLTSELVDRLERLEGPLGLGALNLIFAVIIATIVICTAALMGDTALAAAERRIGRRPRAPFVRSLLAVGGGAAGTGILVAHLHHPLALDSWVGLAGGLLLAIAAIAHPQLPDTTRPSER